MAATPSGTPGAAGGRFEMTKHKHGRKHKRKGKRH